MTTSSATSFTKTIMTLLLGVSMIVSVATVHAQYISPGGTPPGGNAEEPIYTSAASQQTSGDVGVKAGVSSTSYIFRVLGKSRLAGSMTDPGPAVIALGPVVIAGAGGPIMQGFSGIFSKLDIKGNLFVNGSLGTNPGLVRDQKIAASTSVTLSNPTLIENVCATQAGVLVRCPN